MPKWLPLIGTFEEIPEGILFHGGSEQTEDGKKLFRVGNFISD
jgi:hypothetical protein